MRHFQTSGISQANTVFNHFLEHPQFRLEHQERKIRGVNAPTPNGITLHNYNNQRPP